MLVDLMHKRVFISLPMLYIIHSDLGAQFVLLGVASNNEINNHFWHQKRMLNDNQDCHLELGFNEELSHLIYAGADMVVVPSLI